MESLAPSSSFDAAPPLEIDPNDSGRRGVSSLGSSKNSHSVTNNDVPQQQEQQRQPCSMPSWSMPRESANTNTNNLLLEPNPIDYSALWCVRNDVETSTPWRAPSPATLLQQLDFSFPAHQRQYGGSQVSLNSTLCDTSAAGALPSPPVLPRMHSGIITGNSTDGKSNQSVLANFFSNSDNSCRNSLRDEQHQQQQALVSSYLLHTTTARPPVSAPAASAQRERSGRTGTTQCTGAPQAWCSPPRPTPTETEVTERQGPGQLPGG